jgi:hypothetical protein
MTLLKEVHFHRRDHRDRRDDLKILRKQSVYIKNRYLFSAFSAVS